MTLTPGTRLGPYEVIAPIGAGGMGEVYRASDRDLKRAVALKVLPDAVASSAARLARFQREAEVLASLNHPNIAQVYGLERSTGVHALVMELVDGESLDERIMRGPVPLDESLPIARQIADALAAAHGQGVIHRDLKPSNVMVRGDGAVKVLDFGLAKVLDDDPGPASSPLDPTITTPAITQAGIIMGTAAYMSPEQAKGKAVDKRADVWSFGCVLYEMLAGVRAFRTESVAETIALVLERDPDWTRLPAGTPPAVRVLLKRCLEKDRQKRIPDIAAAALLIEELPALTTATADASVREQIASAVAIARRDAARRSTRWAALALVGGTLLAIIAAAVGWFARQPVSPSVVRTMITPSGPTALSLAGFDRDVAITPDGTRIVYRGADQLLLRPLDSLEATVLVTGGNPQGIFFSPDSQWVGFFDGSSTLKKVAMAGGPAVSLTTATSEFSRGATWGEDGTIVFATQGSNGLLRVPSSGGEPARIATPDRSRGEGEYIWPEFLPGGRALLFTISGSGGQSIAVIDLDTQALKTLVRGGGGARYVASGHLVYGSDDDVLAVRFDLQRLEVIGTPSIVLRDVAMTAGGGNNVAVSRDGTLAYLSGAGGLSDPRSLVWTDRAGREEAVPAPPRNYQIARVSPDGTRVALDIRGQDNDLWTWAFEPQTLTRLTSAPGTDMFPVWTQDSQRVIFTAAPDKSARRHLEWRTADGSRPSERLFEDDAPGSAYRLYGLTPDESTLIVGRSGDVYTIALGDPTRADALKPLLHNTFAEQNAEVSPDGRWIAYQSNESGDHEVYVRPFPQVDSGRAQISTNGGRTPLWSRSGNELFYRASTGAVMAVRVERGSTWRNSAAVQVVAPGFYDSGEVMRTFDVSPDGSRFLMIKQNSVSAGIPRSIVLVQHWFEELKRVAPGS